MPSYTRMAFKDTLMALDLHIEGLLSVFVSVSMKFLIVDWQETASFLTEEERAVLRRRLVPDQASGIAKMNRLDRSATRHILKDWKIYIEVRYSKSEVLMH